MSRHTNIKTVAIGGILLSVLFLLVGASRSGPSLQVGRFQIDCTSNSCYLVDTATGQVWRGGGREFYSPKLESQAAGPPAKAEDFIGQWRWDEEDVTLWLEEGGTARASENDKEHQGRWHAAGGKLVVTISDEDGETLDFKGEIAPRGSLVLWEAKSHDDERASFRRVK